MARRGLSNRELSGALSEYAALLELSGAEYYAARAYRRAAELVSGMPVSVVELVSSGRIRELRGMVRNKDSKLLAPHRHVRARIAILRKLARTSARAYTSTTRHDEHTVVNCGAPTVGCLAARPDSIVVQEPVLRVRRDDVLLFNPSARADTRCPGGGFFVLGVIALPGETWSETGGYVYVDGKKLDEPYINPLYRDRHTYAKTFIPAGHYFVMGDNRAASCDSRAFGPVPAWNLVGKVVEILRPGVKSRRP